MQGKKEPVKSPSAEEGLEFVAGTAEEKERLDVFLARNVPGMTRSQAARRLEGGKVLVNGRREK